MIVSSAAPSLSTSDKFIVIRTLRKKQFCRVELKPNSNYKPEEKDPNRKPLFDIARADQLKKSLSCKGRMVDGTDICKFPERHLRSCSTLPPKKPPPSRAYKTKNINNLKTEFRRRYERNDLPLFIAVSAGTKRSLAWKAHYGEVDYYTFLPLFFEGLLEKRDPLKFLARAGTQEMLEYVDYRSLLEALPAVMLHISVALDTKDREIICETLKCLQKMILRHNSIGPELIQYYRQMLPVMRMFMSSNKNLGDTIEYSQYKRVNVSDLIHETLHLLEVFGGETAFYNIKKIIPLYTSKQQILAPLPAEELARRQARPLKPLTSSLSRPLSLDRQH